MAIGVTLNICNGTQAQNELLCRDWCADAITVVVGTLHKTVFAGIALPCQQVVHSTHKALLLLLAPILIVDAWGVGWRLATTTIRPTKTSMQWLSCENKSAEQVMDCNREIDSSELTASLTTAIFKNSTPPQTIPEPPKAAKYSFSLSQLWVFPSPAAQELLFLSLFWIGRYV